MSEATYRGEREAEEVARMEEAIGGMTSDEVYDYCRKLEDDRIRKHFSSTDIGKLENEMFCSFDQLVDSFEDPSKIQVLSDHGTGGDKVLRTDADNTIAHALSFLSPKLRAFAEDVLNGKKWEEIGISESTFYRLMKKVENIFRNIDSTPLKTFP